MTRKQRRALWLVAQVTAMLLAGVWFQRSASAAGSGAAPTGHGYLTRGLLDPLPLPVLFLLVAAGSMISVRVGVVLGRRLGQEKEGPVDAVVAAVIGLLAFVLAFTFGIASNRFDTRKQTLLDEVESIGTTYLRAGLLPPAEGEAIRESLRQYVDLRLEAALDPGRREAALRESEELHTVLWAQAESLVAAGNKTDVDALFIDSLNRTIDLHTRRAATALHYRVPSMVWVMLLAASMVAMVMVGYMFGVSGSGRPVLDLALALVFSAVITLTSGLDRPGSALVSVSQVPMMELQRMVRAPRPSAAAPEAPRTGP